MNLIISKRNHTGTWIDTNENMKSSLMKLMNYERSINLTDIILNKIRKMRALIMRYFLKI